MPMLLSVFHIAGLRLSPSKFSSKTSLYWANELSERVVKRIISSFLMVPYFEVYNLWAKIENSARIDISFLDAYFRNGKRIRQ
jgi:hypothetical protein